MKIVKKKIDSSIMKKPMKDSESILFTIARAQAGYFTARQAIEAGYADSQHVYHCKAGNWLRVDKGIYRYPDAPDTIESEMIRWSLWSRNQKDVRLGIISHDTALYYYGLIKKKPLQIHLSVTSNFRKRKPKECVLHKLTAKNPLHREKDIKDFGAFRVASPMRTLKDTSAVLFKKGVLHEIVRLALEKGLVTSKELKSAGFACKKEEMPSIFTVRLQVPGEKSTQPLEILIRGEKISLTDNELEISPVREIAVNGVRILEKLSYKLPGI